MTGDNAAVTDVELLNSFNGISAVQAHRHYIARVQGQPLQTGLFVDQTYDIGRIENVHWNPWWSQDVHVTQFQAVYGRAFVIARSDWEYVFNTFCFGYAIGYHFITSSTGSMNGNFLGIGADLAFNASVQVDGAQPMGILITNGEFTAFDDTNFCPICTYPPTHVVVTGTNTGPVRFVNSAFWGPAAQIATLDGTGLIGFSDCEFVDWDTGNKGRAGIQVNSGSLIVRGCDFQHDGIQIQLSNKVQKAVIVANVLRGAERIVDQGAANVQKGYNAAG